MAGLESIVERLRGFDLERALGLRPAAPRVAVELDRHVMSLVRIKPARRGSPQLESQTVVPLDEPVVPATLFDGRTRSGAGLTERLRAAFESSGTKPGRVAIVLPDNLAKISMIALPEWPTSRRQLEEIIHFKMRRSVPFRLTEASLCYQALPTDGPGVNVLVALMRRTVAEGFEAALTGLGCRPGVVSLSTPNLLNLCRERIETEGESGDVALLNCARNYFTLVIVRDGKLIFFRCKSYSLGEQDAAPADGMLAREIASSFSYYQEKLEGQGIGAVLVRSVAGTLEEIGPMLAGLEADRVEMIDPASRVELAEDARFDAETGQRLAPAIGAVMGAA